MKAYLLYDEYLQPASVNVYIAHRGFVARGYEVIGFQAPTILQYDPGWSREDIVVGSVQVARASLKRFGIVPVTIDIPESLMGYAGRHVWRTTLGRVRSGQMPLFIKPLYEHKKFSGHLLEKPTDLLRTERYSDDEPVLAQTKVDFVSEWRVFVHGGDVIGISHYKGDPLTMPDKEIIRSAIRDYRDAPVAYGIDFGICSGKTRLVEVNDAFALGAYGLPAGLYTGMIEARWMELTR